MPAYHKPYCLYCERRKKASSAKRLNASTWAAARRAHSSLMRLPAANSWPMTDSVY